MVTTTTTGLLLWKIVVAGAILLAGVGLGSWLSGAVSLALERSGLDPVVRRGLARTVRPAVVAVAAIAAVEHLEVDLTIVAAVVGAAALAIGLSLRGALANVATGGVLLTLRPFREGEWIVCAGEQGRVVEQGPFAVVLERADGTLVTLSNELAFSAPILNHSRRGLRRFEISAALPAEVEIGEARKRILEQIAADVRILTSPEPTVTACPAEGGARLVARGWVPSPLHDEVVAALGEVMLTAIAEPRPASGRARRGSS